MPIRLSQGSLPRHLQVRRTGLSVARARKSIPCLQDPRIRELIIMTFFRSWGIECAGRRIPSMTATDIAGLWRCCVAVVEIGIQAA